MTIEVGHTIPTATLKYIGVDGVTSSMSFSDAVNLFNEQYGMNLTDEEAQQAISEDVCWLYGIC